MPEPPKPAEPKVIFEEYIPKQDHCLDTLESFESCSKVFCQDYPQECVGKKFPPYEAFNKDEF